MFFVPFELGWKKMWNTMINQNQHNDYAHNDSIFCYFSIDMYTIDSWL